MCKKMHLINNTMNIIHISHIKTESEDSNKLTSTSNKTT